MNNRLLTPDEAATLLRMSRSSFYRLMRAGAVATVKVGHRMLVQSDALQAFVDDRVRCGPAAPPKESSDPQAEGGT